MTTLQIVTPVLIMLLIGFMCHKTELITHDGIQNIKKYITTFPLPLAIFHAVATATYNKNIIIIFVIMLIAVVIGLAVGFLLQGLIKEPYKKYFPYLMTIYEGGMMAFPLYQSLMGVENMSNIAIIDVPCGVFAFGIYFGLIKMTDQGTKINGKDLLKNAFSTPSFIALILGLVLGVTGLMETFMSFNLSNLYISIKELITAPLSAMILLCVGYEFILEKDSIKECLKTVFLRLIIQSCLFIIVYMIARKLDFTEPMIIGLALYFFTLPSLCLSSFVKNKDASKYIATTSSIYLIITLIAYIILAGII